MFLSGHVPQGCRPVFLMGGFLVFQGRRICPRGQKTSPMQLPVERPPNVKNATRWGRTDLLLGQAYRSLCGKATAFLCGKRASVGSSCFQVGRGQVSSCASEQLSFASCPALKRLCCRLDRVNGSSSWYHTKRIHKNFKNIVTDNHLYCFYFSMIFFVQTEAFRC